MDKKAFLRPRFLLTLLFVAGLSALVALAPIVRADTITVTTTADDVVVNGNCTLREAVIAANTDTAVDACAAGNGDDFITLPPGTYVLTIAGAEEEAAQTGDLDLTGMLTLNGAGLNDTVIDGSGLDRVFDVQSNAAVHISAVTIRNGNATFGGGVRVGINSQLILSNSRVTGNSATIGGGGIHTDSGLTLSNSRVDGNDAGSAGGGGILISFGFVPVIISHSEISGNSAETSGGGIFNSGTLTLANSTLSGNSADRDGGGLFAVESPNTQLYNVTVSANTADADGDGVGDGGGIRPVGSLNATHTLIGGNNDNSSSGNHYPDCAGTLNSQGYNLVANVTGCNMTGDSTGNLLGVDPALGALQNNGGDTFTHALLAGSPAIDAGNPSGCRDQDGNLLTTDQRGFPRPGGSSTLCDIGAYEAGSADTPTPTPTTTAVPTVTVTPDQWNYLPIIIE